MKKIITILSVSLLVFIAGAVFTACNSTKNKTKTEVKTEAKTATKKEAAVYECPMHCEGDKTYDKPGNCPVCGMKLKKVAMAENHQEHNH